VENVQEQVRIAVLVMKCLQGLDACVDPGVYDQMLHHRSNSVEPRPAEGGGSGDVGRGVLSANEADQNDGSCWRSGGVFVGKTLRNAPDIAALRKSHENVQISISPVEPLPFPALPHGYLHLVGKVAPIIPRASNAGISWVP
jgi:hypothetical protein